MTDAEHAPDSGQPHFPEAGSEPEFNRVEKKFEKFVRSKGLKLTSQRRRILKRVFENHDHFTAEDMYDQLRRGKNGISRATVYRTLSLLVDGGFLEMLDLGQDRKYYEHIYGHEHHDHLICTRCDAIVEFQEPRIEALQDEVGCMHGFYIQDHSLRLFGLCSKCQGESKAGGA